MTFTFNLLLFQGNQFRFKSAKAYKRRTGIRHFLIGPILTIQNSLFIVFITKSTGKKASITPVQEYGCRYVRETAPKSSQR